MINHFLGVALVAAPFFIKTGAWTTTVQSQEYFLAIIAVFYALAFGIKKAHKNILIMSAFLVLYAFTTHNPFGIFQYYQLAMCFCGVLFISFVYSHRERIEIDTIAKYLGAVCLLESGWIIAQHFGINIHAEIISLISGKYRSVPMNMHALYGSLGNVNHSAALIACTMPFLNPALWFIPIIVLIMAKSALPIICAFVAVISMYSYRKRNYTILKAMGIALLVLAIMTFFGAFEGTFLSDSHRVTAWKELYKAIGVQFWGKGLGWVPEIFSKNLIHGQKFYQIHNEWLELYAIGGLLSVVVALYLISPIFENMGNPKVNACLIALLVNSLGNFSFHIAPLFMVFAFCYAVQLPDAKE